MNKKLLQSIVVAALAPLMFSCGGSTPPAKVVTIGADLQEDATYAIYTALREARESGSPLTLSFEKGTYNFYTEHAKEKYIYISNHGDQLSRIAFDMENMSNVTVEGNGADFMFHGVMVPFLIANGENITVKNLSIDFAEPFHSEGVVIATDPKRKSFDMSFGDEYPYEIRNGELIFLRSDYEHSIGQTIYYDPETMGIAHNTSAYAAGSMGKVQVRNIAEPFEYKYEKDLRDLDVVKRGVYDNTQVEQLRPGVLRFSNVKKQLPELGWILTFKGSQSFNRIAPAFKICNTINFLAEGVTVYHAGGMGFLCENSENLTLDGCVVTPSQGRIVSTAADASHFVGCRGEVVLRNCKFQNQLDDASNIHGAYQKIVDRIDDNTLGLRIGHHQQLGFMLGRAGDKVGLVRLSESFHPYQVLTIKSNEMINGRYHIVTFEEKIPAEVEAGDLVENITAYPNLLVENCVFDRNRARGLLISVPTTTIIRNNIFNTQMEALLLPVESSSWFESGNATNVLIEGNTFTDCTNGMDRGVIRFVTDDESDDHAFKNITIRDNTFNHYDNMILELNNIDGLLFEGNTINSTDTYPMAYPENPAVRVGNSINLTFKDNNFNGKAKVMVKTTDGSEPVAFQ